MPIISPAMASSTFSRWLAMSMVDWASFISFPVLERITDIPLSKVPEHMRRKASLSSVSRVHICLYLEDEAAARLVLRGSHRRQWSFLDREQATCPKNVGEKATVPKSARADPKNTGESFPARTASSSNGLPAPWISSISSRSDERLRPEI